MVLKTLIMNSNNYVSNSGNIFRYYFPGNGLKFENAKIGLQQVNIFNSSFNISQALGNNTFQIIWRANFSDSSTSKTFNFTIDDGYYSVAQLNYYLQNCMINNKLYLISGSKNIYYLEFVSNETKYALGINVYVLPTSLGSYSYPDGCNWTLSSSVVSPTIIINSGLQNWFGFSSQTSFPPQSITTDQNYLSDIAPIVNPINSYILTCNMISSKYSQPSNIFFSIPLTASFGSLITINQSNPIMLDIFNSNYLYLEITLLDQNLNKLNFQDKEILLILIISE